MTVKHKVVILPDGINKTADPNTFIMMELEKENKTAATALNLFDFDGRVCLRKAPRKKVNQNSCYCS